jgi:hypothetical protein
VDEIGFDPEENADSSEKLRVVKSGTDFRELSMITMDIERDEKGKCRVKAIQGKLHIYCSRLKQFRNSFDTDAAACCHFPEAERKPTTSNVMVDEETDKLVQEIGKTVSAKIEYAIGYTLEGLDGRSSAVRTKETNLGNLTSDLMMNAYNSVIGQVDVALNCGGTYRSDKVHGPGPVTIGDILDIFPYEDPVVVIKVTGQQLWDALENGVSEYPKQEGRFPQVAGMRVEWNPSAEPFKRLRKVHCMVHSKQGVSDCLASGRSLSTPTKFEPSPLRINQDRYKVENMVPLDLNKSYWLATRAYMADTYDGYTALKVDKKDVLIDDEQGLIISTLFRKFFLGLKYINAIQDSLANKRRHDEKVKEVVASVATKWKQKAAAGSQRDENLVSPNPHPVKKALDHCTTSGIRNAFSGSTQGHPDCIGSESDDEDDDSDRHNENHWIRRWATIAPSVDGRIVEVDY